MPIDVIVVLGGGLSSTGTLPHTAQLRMRHAASLLEHAAPAKLLISGGRGLTAPRNKHGSEASAMARYGETIGIRPEQIVLEEESVDTFGNAFLTRRILEARNWRSVLLTTSDFHVPRSAYLFAKVLGPRFRLVCSGAPTELGPAELAEAWAAEFGIWQMWKELLDPIEGGDMAALGSIWESHAGYFPDGDLSIPYLVERPSELCRLWGLRPGA